MKKHGFIWLGLGVLSVWLLAWLALTAWLVLSTQTPAQQSTLFGLLRPKLPLVAVSTLIGLLSAAFPLRWVLRRHLRPAPRLLEQVRALLSSDAARVVVAAGAPVYRDLAEAINALADQRAARHQKVRLRVEEANRSLQQERNRLAALVSELAQSVVVCNLDGRIVLYNNRARLQLRVLSQAPTVVDGAELVGIGRSIYAIFDHGLVAHALDQIHERLERGAAAPTAQFVMGTAGGQLLRVQVAPVRTVEGETAEAGGIGGFVLLLDNVSQGHEERGARHEAQRALNEAGRASIARMTQTLEQLGPQGEDVVQALRAELGALGAQMNVLANQAADGRKTRWPLEDMRGEDLLGVAQRRITARAGSELALEAVASAPWVRVDSYGLLRVMVYLARRLAAEVDVHQLTLRLQEDGGHAQLDLMWQGPSVSAAVVTAWKTDTMQSDDDASRLTVHDVMERHGGDMWFESAGDQSYFRIQLPLAAAADPLRAADLMTAGSRPEFYDFDLFQSTDESRALDERELVSLNFTVFDTETTGLQPSAGDEIIQLGAVRIVNGKLLRHESFDRLVDPGRSIPAASIPIHGITPDMVRGQPGIAAVLPAFHAYVQDSVLVAHNAAFDMRFLQLKEQATGIVFHQPVLDTLLLSALVHPNQDSHRLEAIAERFGIPVLGRHTALGDAIVTAEVLLRLIPLLQAQGIHTLRQAREAAQSTYLARLKY